MSAFLLTSAAAFWLGILTSISPCPLAGNIAALSYVSGNAKSARRTLLLGTFYTAGRVLSYTIVAGIAVLGFMALSDLSFFLQMHLNKFLGPVFIITGMLMLELINVSVPGGNVAGRLQDWVGRMGAAGAFVLGLLLALAFCPVSAALFFGALVPTALSSKSPVLLPVLYGIGTALPVIVFALVLAFGRQSLSVFYTRLSSIENIARKGTGALLILIGLYYVLKYSFGIL